MTRDTAGELEAGRTELLVRFEKEAAKRSEKLTLLYNEQLQKLTGQLNLNKGEVQEIAQSFGIKLPGKLDIKGGGLLPITDIARSRVIPPIATSGRLSARSRSAARRTPSRPRAWYPVSLLRVLKTGPMAT